MNDNSRIKYTFHNESGEVVEMTFTIVEIEGMTGGFMKAIQKELDDMGFGKPKEVYRMLLM